MRALNPLLGKFRPAGSQLLGADAEVKARIKAYETAGVTTLKVGLDGAGPLGPARFEALERFMDLIKDNA